MEKLIPIYGYIGVLRFTLTTGNGDEDDQLLVYAKELHTRLESEINDQVRETLGPEFEVLRVEINEGSIHILIYLGAVGMFYMGFSRYESFIKSVNLVVSQLKALLQRFFGRTASSANGPSVSLTGLWQPGPAIESANQVLSSRSRFDSSNLLLAYLILSHAALLAFLLWLVSRHLK